MSPPALIRERVSLPTFSGSSAWKSALRQPLSDDPITANHVTRSTKYSPSGVGKSERQAGAADVVGQDLATDRRLRSSGAFGALAKPAGDPDRRRRLRPGPGLTLRV